MGDVEHGQNVVVRVKLEVNSGQCEYNWVCAERPAEYGQDLPDSTFSQGVMAS